MGRVRAAASGAKHPGQTSTPVLRASGAELDTADGRRLLDVLSGYCVHNVGHNHPRVREAVADAIGRGLSSSRRR